jgi:hypothetical protein
MKTDFEIRENDYKDILNENDHDSETKNRQINQLTSQVKKKTITFIYFNQRKLRTISYSG